MLKLSGSSIMASDDKRYLWWHEHLPYPPPSLRLPRAIQECHDVIIINWSTLIINYRWSSSCSASSKASSSHSSSVIVIVVVASSSLLTSSSSYFSSTSSSTSRHPPRVVLLTTFRVMLAMSICFARHPLPLFVFTARRLVNKFVARLQNMPL